MSGSGGSQEDKQPCRRVHEWEYSNFYCGTPPPAVPSPPGEAWEWGDADPPGTAGRRERPRISPPVGYDGYIPGRGRSGLIRDGRPAWSPSPLRRRPLYMEYSPPRHAIQSIRGPAYSPPSAYSPPRRLSSPLRYRSSCLDRDRDCTTRQDTYLGPIPSPARHRSPSLLTHTSVLTSTSTFSRRRSESPPIFRDSFNPGRPIIPPSISSPAFRDVRSPPPVFRLRRSPSPIFRDRSRPLTTTLDLPSRKRPLTTSRTYDSYRHSTRSRSIFSSVRSGLSSALRSVPQRDLNKLGYAAGEFLADRLGWNDLEGGRSTTRKRL
ncbi:hypothetical protein VTI74DRAFT_7171 [Chaetomium olivicolor]